MERKIDKANVQDIFELTPAQKGMLFDFLRNTDQNMYNNQLCLRVEGTLDAALLEQAFRVVQAGNEVLRSVFSWEKLNKPLQVVFKDCPIDLSYTDLSAYGDDARHLLEQQRAADRDARFDLRDLPLRVRITRWSDDIHFIDITHHHILYDGWSNGILLSELFRYYGELLADRIPVPVAKPSYRAILQQTLARTDTEANETYWKNYLDGHEAAPLFGGRHVPAPGIQKLLVQADPTPLDAFARTHKLTKAAVLNAAYALLLRLYTGRNDVAFGSVLSTREADVRGSDMVAGNFINTLPLRSRFNDDATLLEGVSALQSDSISRQAFQQTSYAEIKQVAGLKPAATLFDSLLVVENYPVEGGLGAASGLAVTLDDVYENSGLPLALGVFFREYVEIQLSYNSGYLTAGQAQLFAQHYLHVLNVLLSAPLSRVGDLTLPICENYQALANGIVHRKEDADVPASYHQERLWFIDRFETGTLYAAGPVYHNIPLALRLKGAVDLDLLEQAVRAAFNANSNWRTSVRTINEQPFQHIGQQTDLLLIHTDRAGADPEAVIRAAADQPLPIAGTLVRGELAQLNQNDHLLVLVAHHAIADRYSMDLLEQQIVANYQALTSGGALTPAETLSYSDFARWQREELSHLYFYLVSYWRRQLGQVKPLELPTDRPRALVHIYTAGVQPMQLDRSLVRALLEHEARTGIDTRVLLTAAFKILLNRYCGHEEIVIGTVIDNRDTPVLARLTGPASNAVVLKSFVPSEESFDQYVQTLSRIYTDAVAHGAMPFDLLVTELAPEKDMSRTALYDVLFQYSVAPEMPAGLDVQRIDTSLGYGKYDLHLSLAEGAEGIGGNLVFNLDYYDASTIRRMAGHFYELLGNLLRQPAAPLSDVDMIGAGERALLLSQFDRKGIDYPRRTINAIFSEQARRNPQQVAVRCGADSITYGQLEMRSGKVACLLQQHGIGRGHIVALLSDRGIDTIVAMLGVLKAGAAYLPIDVDYPKERIDYLLNDSGAPLVLTTRAWGAGYDGAVPVVYLEDAVRLPIVDEVKGGHSPLDLCYVIYTSGTTGNPKGVMIEHKDVVRLLFNDEMPYDFSASDTWTMFHSHCFDFSVWEIYGALLYGATLVVVPKAVARDPQAFRALLKDERVTILNQTPTAFYQLTQEEAHWPDRLDVRSVIFAGEALWPGKLRSWKEKYPDTLLVNMYGITEITVHATYKEIGDYEIDHNISNIGLPIPTLSMVLLDEHRRLVPNGITGEIYVGGIGVGRGYLGREALTRQRFIQDPYNPGERLYRSGDLARVLPNGEMEYLGRMDQQVQLRGFRIELGEIESQLKLVDGVRETCVVGRQKGDDLVLVAYYASDRPIEIATLRAHLLQKLPDYMVPSYFVELPALPLTSNGKLDKQRLPDPEIVSEQDYVAPSHPIEEKLVAIWADVLHLDPGVIGVRNNFFELGGHSLRATVLVNQIYKHFDVRLPLQRIFTHPDIEGLRTLIEAEERSKFVPLRKAAPRPHYRLSAAQRRLYFLYQLAPESLAYNMPYVIRLKGAVDKERMERAFERLIARHHILHTAFELIDGDAMQVIVPASSFHIEEYGGNGNEDAIIKSFVRPFDLAQPPLLRAALIHSADNDHLLVVDMHHIVNDGVSGGIFVRDFVRLYGGEELAAPELQYIDFAEWQQGPDQQQRIANQKEYWLREFAEGIPTLELPTDRPRPAIKEYGGDSVRFALSAEETAALKRLADEEGATLFMVVCAIYSILLAKLSNSDDVVIGTAVAGREHADLSDMMGVFLNLLPIRTRPEGGRTVREFVRDVKAGTLAAFQHQDYPYEELIDALKVERDTSRNPIFDALFLFQNFEDASLSIPGLEADTYNYVHPVAKFDLTLLATEADGRLELELEYATSLFDRATAEGFADALRRVVTAISGPAGRRISQVSLLSDAERRYQLDDLNATAGAFPGGTIVSLFEEQARKTPDKTALVYENSSLTYRELDERSALAARRLRSICELKPDSVVGILMDRSADTIVAMLAVLRAGAAYLPLDPAYPAERLNYILQDSRARLVITDKDLPTATTAVTMEALTTGATDGIELAGPNPQDLCYLIYTSGSTGQPKGVMIEHHNVVNFFTGITQTLQPRPDDCLLAITSTSFDISVLELFWTLCNGVEVVIHPSDMSIGGLDRYLGDGTDGLDFSLFFFSSYDTAQDDKYHLLTQSVQYADRSGFKAVWVPERHFHEFGGLFPNPSVVSAALAMITEKIELRSGSVVSPLHDPLRIAEEWSVVDNLSKGRVALSFASGWNPDDFALAKSGTYKDRHATMYRQIDEVRHLWRGGSATRTNGVGKEVELRVFPQPLQKELPVWVTSAGSADTFRSAGTAGANVLTHFLGQDIDMLAANIRAYREARRAAGYDEGQVSLMVHAFVGDDMAEVERIVEQPFINYLRSSIGLSKVIFEQAGFGADDLTEELKDQLLKAAFRRYYKTGSLIGTRSSCSETLRRLKEIGVDEVACLIDFGVEENLVMQSLSQLGKLKELHTKRRRAHRPVTMLQATPSFLRLLGEDAGSAHFVASLRTVLVGGEALSASVLRSLYGRNADVEVYNMYGPTETTIWSCLQKLNRNEEKIYIGKPILNTQVYVLDKHLQLLPAGVPGDLYIGGEGLARGYWNRPKLTAERFLDNPFVKGGRIYLTGDVVRWSKDGRLEYLERRDHQVKIRGFRIELGEIETQLLAHASVREAVVVAIEGVGEKQLAAYYVAAETIDVLELRAFLRRQLPDHMVPAFFVRLDRLPLTISGKVDRKALPAPEAQVTEHYVPPVTAEETLLAQVWAQVLGVARVGLADNFFAVGGDSIKSIQIISRLRTAGYALKVKDIFTTRNVGELALRLQPLTAVADQSAVTGVSELSPIQRWFFAGNPVAPHHYNQAVVLHFADGMDADETRAVFARLQAHHDALRMTFAPDAAGIYTVDTKAVNELPLALEEHDLRNGGSFEAIAEALQGSIDLANGPLMKLALVHDERGSRLLIVIHHLVVDGISWRILFEDLQTLHEQWTKGEPLQLPLKTDAFRRWPLHLEGYRNTRSYANAARYWDEATAEPCPVLPRDGDAQTPNRLADQRSVYVQLSAEETQGLVTQAHRAFQTQDLLLAALLLAVRKRYGQDALGVMLEGHGREELVPGIDISRTVGWFTSLYPVRLSGDGDDISVLRQVKEVLRSIPNKGVDYLLWRYAGERSMKLRPQVFFNYLGQFDADLEGKHFTAGFKDAGAVESPLETSPYDWNVLGVLSAGQLELRISYSEKQYGNATMNAFAQTYHECLAALIDACGRCQAPALTPSDLTTRALSFRELDALQEKYDVEDAYSLTPMQESLLFHALRNPDSEQYFLQMSYTLSGALDIAAVEKSLSALVQRYAVFRTLYLHEGYPRPVQVVLRERDIDFTYKDLRGECAAAGKSGVVESHAALDRERKFRLDSDRLLRLTVLRLDEKEYRFIWSYHHIVMDGWCLGIIIGDFRAIYESTSKGLAPQLAPAAPFSRYISWLDRQAPADSLHYWKDYLSGYDAVAALPMKDKREAKSGYAHAAREVVLDADKTKALQALCSRMSITLSTILQTAWGLVLARYNDSNDVVFGSVVSGRPAEVENVESMVGLFINTVPVRIRYDDSETLDELLQRVQAAALAGEPHHYSPLSEIQSVSELGRELVDHIMVVENFPVTDSIENTSADGQAVSDVQVVDRNNYDLSLIVLPGRDIRLTAQYNAHRYEDAVIERSLQHLARVVDEVLEHTSAVASAVEIVSGAEREELVRTFNDTYVPVEDETVVALFERQAAATPKNTALVLGDKRISYEDLNGMANDVAAQIVERLGEGRHRVALLFTPSVEMTVAMLGVLKAGCAYVPLSPKDPIERLKRILDDGSAQLLLSLQNLKPMWTNAGIEESRALTIDQEKLNINRSNIGIDVSPEDLIYVIYTSGTTGKPKGVEVKHRGVSNFIRWRNEHYRFDGNDRTLQLFSYSFDGYGSNFYSPLLTGGTMVVPEADELFGSDAIGGLIVRERITCATMTPSLYDVALGQLSGDGIASSLRLVVLGGELVKDELIRKSYTILPETVLYNEYGPTESSIGVTYHPLVDPGAATIDALVRPTSIGRPIRNVSIYILGRIGTLQPVGIGGELCIGGAGLARGYVNDEALTKQKFRDNPFAAGERLYRTGDRARWQADGTIDFLGRLADTQVKIRGFRIELGEIESQLLQHEAVREAVVIAREKTDGEKALMAYYVGGIDAAELKSFLKERVPDYMMPSVFMALDRLPLTTNGKVDVKALPDPAAERTEEGPADEQQQLMIGIWADVLEIDAATIGIGSSFFGLGGHSLKAILLISQINRAFGVEVGLEDIFEKEELKSLTDYVVTLQQLAQGALDTQNNETIEIAI